MQAANFYTQSFQQPFAIQPVVTNAFAFQQPQDHTSNQPSSGRNSKKKNKQNFQQYKLEVASGNSLALIKGQINYNLENPEEAPQSKKKRKSKSIEKKNESEAGTEGRDISSLIMPLDKVGCFGIPMPGVDVFDNFGDGLTMVKNYAREIGFTIISEDKTSLTMRRIRCSKSNELKSHNHLIQRLTMAMII
ncbi:hypothetical protein FGO68_gene16328 [Halteria grandinella]|uniref:Uncharacterized protein n=1 Tax=Halteria grandinella TaxID=5974 RepID=A0A8J8T6F6_HALGN|nr:hypothetical protein FGO68_gene16328 [Halteria grandinella]